MKFLPRVNNQKIQGLTLLISVTQVIALRCSEGILHELVWMTRSTKNNALKIENTAYAVFVV